jgi:hypothetical protein
VDPELSEDHLRRLAEAGIDVEQVVGMGQLELRGWQDAYLRGVASIRTRCWPCSKS